MPIAFGAWLLAVAVGMALNVVQRPTIGYDAGPEDMMVPLALVFSGLGGVLAATLGFALPAPRWASALLATLAALVAAVFGMGCGYGCFSAVWAT